MKRRIYGYNIVYSPDDKGYYGEVSNARTGKTIYTTPVLPEYHAVLMHITAKYSGHHLIKIGD